MEELFYGRVVDLVRKTAGSPLAADAGIAVTVLQVEDATDFDEVGGMVQVGVDTYVYDAVDYDADTVTLSTGLLNAALADDLVEVFNEELGQVDVEYVAHVLLEDQDPGDEPIEVTVQHGLVQMLAESVRGGASETVTLIRDGEDDFLIFQVDGKLAVNIELETVKGGYEGTLQDIFDRADQAAADAAEAALAADFAYNTANGRVRWSLNAPGATANNAGDVWFQKDYTTQDIIGQWEGLGGNSWRSVELRNEVIANLDAGKLTAGSAFTNALWVKTNLTLGDASTNGVIQSYNFAGSSVGVFIDKYGIVAKGGSLSGTSITGAIVTGGLVRTGESGDRIELQWNPSTGYPELTFFEGTSSSYLRRTSNTLQTDAALAAPQFQATGPTGLYCKKISGTGGVFPAIELELEASRTHTGGTFEAAQVFVKAPDSTTNAANVRFNSVSGQLLLVTSSAAKYKENIAAADMSGFVDALKSLGQWTYTYREDYHPGGNTQFGLIADEVEAAGLTPWVGHDPETGEVEDVDYGRLTVPIIAWMQQHEARLAALEGAPA